MEQGVTVMDWPSRSPYLDRRKNAMYILVRDVYAGFRQFHPLDDLQGVIVVAS